MNTKFTRRHALLVASAASAAAIMAGCASRPTPAPPAKPAPVAERAAPAPAVAPVASGLPKVQAFELSLEALNQVAQSSGLEWVNSNADKVAQVQAAIAAEPKPIHVPREPKVVAMPDDGPLVLVETRKDLRNMPLPFEAQ
jgi:ribonuclease E